MGRGKNRGRRKRKEEVRATRWFLSDVELDAALAEMDAGSDRVAAIMGAAHVETTLAGSLVTCLKDRSEADKLFDDVKGPFNTFYGKTLAGRALGLYGEKTEEALHAVREIRNKFAHSPHSLDFRDPDIAKKINDKLSRFTKEHPEHDPEEPATTREFYVVACHSLTLELMRAGTDNLERYAAELRGKSKDADNWLASLGGLSGLKAASGKGGD